METKIFYAVQHGDNFDWDNGAYDYAEAQEMAKDLSEEFPGEEIRIYLFDAKDEALEQAEREWDRLTTYDKNLHTEFVVCSCETEDGIIDWDTVNIIKDYKKRYENV